MGKLPQMPVVSHQGSTLNFDKLQKRVTKLEGGGGGGVHRYESYNSGAIELPEKGEAGQYFSTGDKVTFTLGSEALVLIMVSYAGETNETRIQLWMDGSVMVNENGENIEGVNTARLTTLFPYMETSSVDKGWKLASAAGAATGPNQLGAAMPKLLGAGAHELALVYKRTAGAAGTLKQRRLIVVVLG